jgi:hypothetical protein
MSGKRLATLLLLLSALCPTRILAATPAVPDAPVLQGSLLGGGGPDYTQDAGHRLVRGPGGALFLSGISGSRVFPYTLRIGDSTGEGSFVARYRPDGTGTDWIAFLGSLEIRAIAVDAAGAVYLAGDTGGYSPIASTAQPQAGGNRDAFVAKLRPDGTALDYFTFLGGSQLDLGLAVAVDTNGAVVVSGTTTSKDFPVTAGAAQTVPGGRYDAFVARVSPDGRRIEYATYLGGTGSERAADVAIDPQGRTFVAGRTSGTNLVAGIEEARLGASTGRIDAFVARLGVAGTTFEALARIGGDRNDGAARLALAPGGDVVLLGTTDSEDWPVAGAPLPGANRGGDDLFLARLDAGLTRLESAVWLGSEGTESLERLQYFGGFQIDGEPAGDGNLPFETGGLAIAANGDVLVAATTRNPFWNGVRAAGGNSEVLAARFSPDFATIRWMDLLGGREDDLGAAVADDGAGGAWVAGEAGRPLVPPYFPTTGPSGQADFGGGISDAFLLRLGAVSTAPVNDAFLAATPVLGGRVTVRADLSTATAEPGDPALGDGSPGRTAWWTWTAPVAGRLSIETRPGSPAAWGVYTGSSLSSLTEVATGLQPGVPGRFAVTAGTTYRILLRAPAGQAGPVDWSLRFSGVPNDDFIERTPLTGLPVEVTGDTTRATVEPGEGLLADGSIGGGSVWWEWTATTTGAVEVEVDGGIFLPSLVIFVGDTRESLVRIQSGSGASGPEGSFGRSVTFLATAGVRYPIALDGYIGVSGPFRLRLRTGRPPVNDLFSNRTRLEGPYVVQACSNLRSTFERDASEPPLVRTNALGEVGAPASMNTVWYTWTATDTGRTRVGITNALFDTRVAVYRGNTFGTLVRVADADGLTPDDRNSLAVFEAVAGTEYQIQVDGGNYDGRSGDFLLTLVLDHPPRILPGTLVRETDGALRFGVEAVPGRLLRLEASEDLRTWTEVSSETPTEPRISVRAPSDAGGRRFFRLNSPEGP